MQRLPALCLSLALVAIVGIGASSFARSRSVSPQPSQSEPLVTATLGQTILLVRHAEKGTDDPSDPSLTPEGEERAQELARVLADAGVTHLFSTDYKRTRATLEPLAKRNDLTIQIYDPSAVSQLVRTLGLLPKGSVAVVAGHSNTTPGLFRTLAGRPASGLVNSSFGSVIPDETYDRLFSVTLATFQGKLRCVAGVELRYGKP